MNKSVKGSDYLKKRYKQQTFVLFIYVCVGVFSCAVHSTLKRWDLDGCVFIAQ